MEITGRIIAVLPARGGVSKQGNEWATQEYVLETHDQYPRKMCFEVFGKDKMQQFNIQAGEELTVSFDIDAREWNGRWFNSIRAWKVERVAGAQPIITHEQQAAQQMAAVTRDYAQQVTAQQLTPQTGVQQNVQNDDLPF